MTDFSPFLSPSPTYVQALEERYVVVFVDDLRPTPEACNSISFGCELYDKEVLSTESSDLEDLMGKSELLRVSQFKMLMLKSILSHIQAGDWFVTINLKDGYCHIQIIKGHRKFLRFAFEDKAYQYHVLPFGLALAPRTFTKCMDACVQSCKRVLLLCQQTIFLGMNFNSCMMRGRLFPHVFSH